MWKAIWEYLTYERYGRRALRPGARIALGAAVAALAVILLGTAWSWRTARTGARPAPTLPPPTATAVFAAVTGHRPGAHPHARPGLPGGSPGLGPGPPPGGAAGPEDRQAHPAAQTAAADRSALRLRGAGPGPCPLPGPQPGLPRAGGSGQDPLRALVLGPRDGGAHHPGDRGDQITGFRGPLTTPAAGGSRISSSPTRRWPPGTRTTRSWSMCIRISPGVAWVLSRGAGERGVLPVGSHPTGGRRGGAACSFRSSTRRKPAGGFGSSMQLRFLPGLSMPFRQDRQRTWRPSSGCPCGGGGSCWPASA
jgi:hypothetical protein